MIRIDRNTVELTKQEQAISNYVEYCLDIGLGCVKARDEALAYFELSKSDIDPDFYEWLV